MARKTRTNWKAVSFELQRLRLSDAALEAFEETHDVGAFRTAGRAVGITEEALDWLINEAEKGW
jgi:hypothetical protein